ncbi:hypothetical protein NQ317_000937 [Molorchus minor]|uniref:Uncharacterized protein n=1 Tax=Molorchus minor TaxID=1323400 RepID=A0ABQ9JGQ3_9CUCU|nr:hypothetical protein NQ317_000937 [Molorchus minor]
MIVVIFLNTMFCCKLESFWATADNPSTINTIKQLSQSDYKIIISPLLKTKMKNLLGDEVSNQILPKVETVPSNLRKTEILKCEKRVFLCKQGLAKLALYQGADKCYAIMKERIMPSLVCYIVAKGSPFLSRFNKIILKIVESGLHSFWGRRRKQQMKATSNYSQVNTKFLYDPLKVYLAAFRNNTSELCIVLKLTRQASLCTVQMIFNKLVTFLLPRACISNQSLCNLNCASEEGEQTSHPQDNKDLNS